MTEAAPSSTFTDAERAVWQARYARASSILEYGAGETTRHACAISRPIWTQESDPKWVADLSAEPEVAEAIAIGRCRLRHADIGPVENWGYPADTTHREHWPDYVLAPWAAGEAFDLVFVDGRFRPASVLAAVLHGPPGVEIMVHDFWLRTHYHVVLPYLDWIASADTLAVFNARRDFDRAAAQAAFEAFITDPR